MLNLLGRCRPYVTACFPVSGKWMKYKLQHFNTEELTEQAEDLT